MLKTATAALACFILPFSVQAELHTVQNDTVETPEVFDASDPQVIVSLFREEGYRAILTASDLGFYEIESAANGYAFWLYFQACDDEGANCEIVTFSCGFDFVAPQSEAVLGTWNRDRYTKAYVDEEGDPYVEFSVNMTHGVTRENFADTLTWYTSEALDFVDQIGWEEDDTATAQPI